MLISMAIAYTKLNKNFATLKNKEWKTIREETPEDVEIIIENQALKSKTYSAVCLSNVVFKSCTFTDVTFSCSNLSKSKFIDCTFTNSKFLKCNVTECIFQRTQFEDIVVKSSTFNGSEFERCKGLTFTKELKNIIIFGEP